MGQLVLEKENSEFKRVKLRLKFDIVSYLARAEGLVNMALARPVGQFTQLFYLYLQREEMDFSRFPEFE